MTKCVRAIGDGYIVLHNAYYLPTRKGIERNSIILKKYCDFNQNFI